MCAERGLRTADCGPWSTTWFHFHLDGTLWPMNWMHHSNTNLLLFVDCANAQRDERRSCDSREETIFARSKQRFERNLIRTHATLPSYLMNDNRCDARSIAWIGCELLFSESMIERSNLFGKRWTVPRRCKSSRKQSLPCRSTHLEFIICFSPIFIDRTLTW